MKNKVWIIELRVIDGNLNRHWRPTAGFAFTRGRCQEKKLEWEKINPRDKFRIVQYVPKAKS